MTEFRLQGWVQTPTGDAIPGAEVAILTQPADTTTEPGSALATLYSASFSNSASVTAAVWSGQQITFSLNSVPSDVIPGSYIGVSGASPSGFNSTISDPWLVVSVSGLNVVVLALANPGTWISGGAVATSILPNPVSTDGNGFWFGYCDAGLYTVQVYGSTLQSQLVYPDQQNGTVTGGSVLSVAMTMPGVLFDSSVSGSPITTTGTLAPALITQSANKVFAGPSSGGAATPTFRSIVSADLPGGAGTVTSVALALSLPSFLSAMITGSPVTTTGTLTGTISLATQNANTIFAGPTSGSASAPTFRDLAIADLPFTGSPSSSTFARGDGTWASGASATPVAQVDLTAQQADVGLTTILTPGADGFYRITPWSVITQAATSTSTLPGISISYTDPDSGQSHLVAVSNGTSSNMLGALGEGAAYGIWAASGDPIKFETIGYASSGVTPMQFSLHLRLEGPF